MGEMFFTMIVRTLKWMETTRAIGRKKKKLYQQIIKIDIKFLCDVQKMTDEEVAIHTNVNCSNIQSDYRFAEVYSI